MREVKRMKNANKPAAPTFMHDVKMGLALHKTDDAGLTKREMFAMHFMASWINHHGSSSDYGYSDISAAESAVQSADALLAELEK